MRHSRILWKLYAGYAAVILVAMGLVGFLISRSVEHETLAEIDRSLEVQARLLADITASALASGAPEASPAERAARLQERIARLGRELETRLTVIRGDGVVLADSDENPARMDNHGQRPEVLQAAARGIGTSTRFSRTVERHMRYLALPYAASDEERGFARASLALTLLEERLAAVRRAVLLGAAVATIVGLVLGGYFARRFTLPLMHMASTAGEIARGEYSRRVAVASSDELGELATAFNTMSEELRRSIEAIQAERSKMTAILSSMVEGVVAVDRDERVVHMNKVAGCLLKVKPEEAQGRPIWEVTRIREISEALTSTMRNEEVEHRVVQLPDTQDRYLELHTSPLRAGGSSPAGAVLVLDDITQLRRLERVRRDFVGNVSHELKTPVTAIRGLVETLLDDPEADPEVRQRFLKKVSRQAHRLSSLVSDLLSLSRLESEEDPLELSPLDVREVIEEAVRSLQPKSDEKEMEVVTHLGDEALVVDGDEEALRQAIGNLLANAITYSPRESRVTARAHREDDTVTIEIEDQGPGIEPRHHERIFERFYRVDAARSREMGGTGLGLAIVKHTARALGGDVLLKSEPGVGSIFSIRLPIHQAGREREAVPQ